MAAKKTASKKTKAIEEHIPQPDAIEPPEVKTGPTLGDAAASYIAAIEADGAGAGTIGSYGAELKMAMKHLGENTLLADLSIEVVAAFFKSDAVTKTRTGVQKSQLTIDKSRRVLRLCLLAAADRGMIAVAPIPQVAAKT